MGDLNLWVIIGRLAVEGTKDRILATTTSRQQAEWHLEGLELRGYYARMLEYGPCNTSYHCSEHALETDHPIGCKDCKAHPPQSAARYARHYNQD